MTTEILRNIMYRGETERETDNSPAAESGGVATAAACGGAATVNPPAAVTSPVVGGDRLETVGLVVLDEVHYLGDPDRGSVWEEVSEGSREGSGRMGLGGGVCRGLGKSQWM